MNYSAYSLALWPSYVVGGPVSLRPGTTLLPPVSFAIYIVSGAEPSVDNEEYGFYYSARLWVNVRSSWLGWCFY